MGEQGRDGEKGEGRKAAFQAQVLPWPFSPKTKSWVSVTRTRLGIIPQPVSTAPDTQEGRVLGEGKLGWVQWREGGRHGRPGSPSCLVGPPVPCICGRRELSRVPESPRSSPTPRQLSELSIRGFLTQMSSDSNGRAWRRPGDPLRSEEQPAQLQFAQHVPGRLPS